MQRRSFLTAIATAVLAFLGRKQEVVSGWTGARLEPIAKIQALGIIPPPRFWYCDSVPGRITLAFPKDWTVDDVRAALAECDWPVPPKVCVLHVTRRRALTWVQADGGQIAVYQTLGCERDRFFAGGIEWAIEEALDGYRPPQPTPYPDAVYMRFRWVPNISPMFCCGEG